MIKIPLKQDGKVYNINGKKMRLFPISTLAQKLSEALGVERTTQTVRKWEKKGVIPPATFRSGEKRLYSMEQIGVICKVAKEENIRQGYSLNMTNFSKRVEQELRKVNKKLLDNVKSKEDKER